jgi:hypothetical protein
MFFMEKNLFDILKNSLFYFYLIFSFVVEGKEFLENWKLFEEVLAS